MNEKKFKSVVTHYRDFHADDVFAVAILKMLYPKIKVIRSEYRDMKTIEKADIKVDIGGKYDPNNLYFDHHQSEGAGHRENSIPYASCGLVWHHFGLEIVKDERIFEEIDRKLIQTIDAIDNGIEISEVKIIRPYTISDYIMSLNPQWPDEKIANFDKNFDFAVEFAIHVLKSEISKIKRIIEAEKKLKEYINVNGYKHFLIIEESLPWREYLIKNTSYKYLIRYDEITKNWCIHSVPLMVDSFEVRHNLPKRWSALKGEELEKVSGIEGAVFCHKNLFFAVVKTKKAAIDMVETALQVKN